MGCHFSLEKKSCLSKASVENITGHPFCLKTDISLFMGGMICRAMRVMGRGCWLSK
ncbi:MAG: hypothetical protein QF466_10680 [Desulfobacterales bacterium]|nr:hypothetical protein [Desulfobacterales bacterium]MDP6683350.1 hypothetical protein [Desulfobacterales bacterium]HJO61694.1 hypothetical protein [Desulfobacterales bacterium]